MESILNPSSAVRPQPVVEPSLSPAVRWPSLRWCLLIVIVLFAPGLSALGLVMMSAGEEAPGYPQMAQVQQDAVEEGGLWHTVTDGETLRTIARNYYGTSRLWRAVQLANDVPQRPAHGTRLWLPAIVPEL